MSKGGGARPSAPPLNTLVHILLPIFFNQIIELWFQALRFETYFCTDWKFQNFLLVSFFSQHNRPSNFTREEGGMVSLGPGFNGRGTQPTLPLCFVTTPEEETSVIWEAPGRHRGRYLGGALGGIWEVPWETSGEAPGRDLGGTLGAPLGNGPKPKILENKVAKTWGK